MLGWAIHKKEVQVPQEKDVEVIGKTAKRGRPAKAVSALQRQPQDAHTFMTGFSSQHKDAACVVCGGTDSQTRNKIMICDRCDLCYHQQCVGVGRVPAGAWVCANCSH